MEVRMDKFLWSVRLFKTRSEATQALSGGKVKVDGASAKPSRPVREGDVISLRRGAVQCTYRVKALLGTRVGAALVPEYLEDITPEEERLKAESARLCASRAVVNIRRDKGTGRPTKKERRTLDAAMDLGLDAPEECWED